MRKRKIKRKGSMLLECVIAMFIITIVFTLFIEMSKSDNNSFKIRNDMRLNSIIFNNIVNEIKFNTSIQELENKLIDNKIRIGISKDIFEELKVKNILSINDISSKKIVEINKIKNEHDGILLGFKLVENIENVVLEEEVKKEFWMEEKNLKEDIQ